MGKIADPEVANTFALSILERHGPPQNYANLTRDSSFPRDAF